MRPHIHYFIESCAKALELAEPIVEIGAKRHPSQDKLADLRSLFVNREFIGCDMDIGPGVDRIENLENLTFQNGEVGTFVLCDTLEHVRDLKLAMKELKRCLNPKTGVLLATSVMLFPVHGFPNDYWRFTPEGFRDLAQDFPWVAVYYSGDPYFPHSVTFIASNQELDPEVHENLSKILRKSRPVPHYADAKSAKIFSDLGSLLIESARSSGFDELPAEGETGFLAKDSWVLTPGSWIMVGVPNESTASTLELRINGATLQRVARNSWNVLLHEEVMGVVETAFQFDPDSCELPAGVVQLEIYIVSSEGESIFIARSAPGVILPRSDYESAFILHSIDKRTPYLDAIEISAHKALKLVNDIRGTGERVVVDLGCGFRNSGNIGIDATASNTQADLICLLGFQPLPFEDGSIDEVICRDFLEHIPKAVYLESKGCIHYPVLYLMDEIWRVLRPGGVFKSWTPMYPHPEVFQDPTHLSEWTIKSMDYFCGIYEGAKRIYKIKACFDKIDVREDGFYLFAELRKPQVN